MTAHPTPPRILRIAIALVIVFDLLALLVMIHTTPLIFTVFMFGAQPLFIAALVLLIGAILADLRAKNLV